MILMNPAPASTDDYKQLRKEWLEKRAGDMDRRKAISDSAAYKESDPDAVAAYYRIHFRPALARQEDFEKVIARLRASFTKEGILKARAIEARLMNDTWSRPDYDLLPRLKGLRIWTTRSGSRPISLAQVASAATGSSVRTILPSVRGVPFSGPLPSIAMTASAITKLMGTVAQTSRMLCWMPLQWRMFFGQPYLLPGTTPNMFFMLRVTPDQWCVLTLGIDTTKSASTSTTVLGSQRRLSRV